MNITEALKLFHAAQRAYREALDENNPRLLRALEDVCAVHHMMVVDLEILAHSADRVNTFN